MYSPKTSPYEHSWKQRYRRTMDIKSSKVPTVGLCAVANSLLRLEQIHSLCGRSKMARTWPSVFKKRKDVERYGGVLTTLP